jgi:hypothetical protein
MSQDLRDLVDRTRAALIAEALFYAFGQPPEECKAQSARCYPGESARLEDVDRVIARVTALVDGRTTYQLPPPSDAVMQKAWSRAMAYVDGARRAWNRGGTLGAIYRLAAEPDPLPARIARCRVLAQGIIDGSARHSDVRELARLLLDGVLQ